MKFFLKFVFLNSYLLFDVVLITVFILFLALYGRDKKINIVFYSLLCFLIISILLLSVSGLLGLVFQALIIAIAAILSFVFELLVAGLVGVFFKDTGPEVGFVFVSLLWVLDRNLLCKN